ncbi:MAG TPA: MFS transporter [Caulobacteraceae bacterium]|nr:MFS transporter [Caulobacteraceae bacterium]
MTQATDASPHPRLPLPALIAFSLPGLGPGALAIALGVFLPRYYAGHFGLALAAVGGVFGLIRLLDTGVDPILGLIMDRTRTPVGRYRPWLISSVPILMLAVFMLFEPLTKVTVAYLFGWLFLYYIGTSILGLSHSAWASVIAAKYHERSRVFGVLQVVGILGATTVLLLPSLLEGRKGVPPGVAVPLMGWFVIAAVPIGVLAALIRTPERITTNTESERFAIGDYLRLIFRPDMLRIILADFCLALGPGWMGAIYLFYFHDARGFTIGQASLQLFIYVAAGVFGAGILSRVAMRFGKHRTLMATATGYSLGLITLTFMPKGQMIPVAIFMFIMGFLATSFALLDRAMVADVGDAVRLQYGQNRVGLLYSMITMTQKVAGALSITLSFTVLGAIGYQAKDGVVNTPAAIHGLELVYLIGPVVFVMLGGACYIGYKLNDRRHAEIRAALDERDGVGVEAPVIDGVTGSQAEPGRFAAAE